MNTNEKKYLEELAEEALTLLRSIAVSLENLVEVINTVKESDDS